MKWVLISLIVFLLITISADIYSESDLYGVPNEETSTIVINSSGGNLTCSDCDSRFVNVDGDSMTDALSIYSILHLIQPSIAYGFPALTFEDLGGTSYFILSSGVLSLLNQTTFLIGSNTVITGDLNLSNNNVTADYFIGDGSNLTGIEAGMWDNVSNVATYDGDANVTGNLSAGGFVIYYE